MDVCFGLQVLLKMAYQISFSFFFAGSHVSIFEILQPSLPSRNCYFLRGLMIGCVILLWSICKTRNLTRGLVNKMIFCRSLSAKNSLILHDFANQIFRGAKVNLLMVFQFSIFQYGNFDYESCFYTWPKLCIYLKQGKVN